MSGDLCCWCQGTGEDAADWQWPCPHCAGQGYVWDDNDPDDYDDGGWDGEAVDHGEG